MFRIVALMKNGKELVVAEAETYSCIEKKSTELELQMMDPTSAKLVFRDGGRTVLAKEVAATWITSDGEYLE